MRIIFITTESLMDHSYTMTTWLRKHIELDVIFTAREETEEIKNFCSALNAKFVKRARYKNPLSIFKEIKLLSYIKKQNADLVWFNTLTLLQSLLLKFFIRRPLINAHDIEYHPEESDYHGILSQKITFRIFKHCIAVMSNTQAGIFEKQYGFKPYVLPLPVIDYYEEARRTDDTARETKGQKGITEAGIASPSPQLKIRFLFFGSILPYKGVEKLIEAAKILESKGLEFELNIYGKIRYDHEKIASGIAGLKNVKHENEFINYKDVYHVYETNDIIIIPYIHVSQCGPLLIGYNQNIPCITSDHPGFREYVDNGKSGLIFDNTAGSLADRMEELIKNPEPISKMEKYIQNNIKQRFSMQSLAHKYLEIFKKHVI
jgi:glycosyltransferase involved in cell wall biosynthesis